MMAAATSYRDSRWPVVIESAALVVLGIALMSFFYHSSTAEPGDEIGAPGHDSFYHTKMAAMLPEHGLLGTFPWLRFAYFTDAGNDFVSHHYGFHVLLLPFVQAAKWINGDWLAGGRWAICLCFGLNLMLFNLLLRRGDVPFRYAWVALFFLLPDQFFTRHAFIRAIGPSLVFLQLLLLMLVARRPVWAGVTIAGYIHLYLGAVLYAPVTVALFALAAMAGRAADRRWPWKMVLFALGGWLLGVATYPYFTGMLEFLELQVTGTGLSPDIPVGREWRPYSDPWWFVTMSATVLAIWAGALCLRLRSGPRLSAEELGLLLVQFVFLALTLKARRFIEYWPLLALLSAAYLAAPPLRDLRAWLRDRGSQLSTRYGVGASIAAAVLASGVTAALLWHGITRPSSALLLAEWKLWAMTLPLLALGPLSRIWVHGGGGAWRAAAVLLGSVAIGVIVAGAAVAWGGELPRARLNLHGALWLLAGLVYAAVPLGTWAVTRAARPVPVPHALARSGAVVLAVLGLFGGTLAAGGEHLSTLGRQMRCYYDLDEVRRMMTFLQTQSQPGDVVFTDDWDIFPLFFYHNTHNHYIVGLDPKFTHERRPDVWERYVKISRGQVPARSRIRLVSHEEGFEEQTLDISMADIRTVFGARFVVCDRDHRRLAEALARDRELAELVYPCRTYEACGDAAFVVFRIRTPGEATPVPAAPEPDADGRLHLDRLVPVDAQQGWGTLSFNRSVDGRPLRLGGTRYRRGLGTHAPARLVFDIPPGYAWFEATVGIDDETNGAGSVEVSVWLDGRAVYVSPHLTGRSSPVHVRVPLQGARTLALCADPTEDGQRFDHVDWADARLVRGETAPGAADAAQLAARRPVGRTP